MKCPALVAVGLWLALATAACAQAKKPAEPPQMERAPVRGAQLEYEVRGRGEPVLLIHGSHIAAAFLPLMNEPALADYRLIRYHRRGFAESAKHDGPCSIEDQAADALGVLRHLGVKRAHIVGHSFGGVIALQLAHDAPEVAHSLVLMEPSLVVIQSGADFADAMMAPMAKRYRDGDAAGSVDAFMRVVAGPEWRTEVARVVPGGPEQAVKDAATFFDVEMPALSQWHFDEAKAQKISQPVVYVLGSKSGLGFEAGRKLVHAWFPRTEDCLVEGVTHSLQMQDPQAVAEGIAEFLKRHPMEGETAK